MRRNIFASFLCGWSSDMAVDFFFDPPTIGIPPLGALRAFQWEHMPEKIRPVLAQESQYLQFHLQMLDRVKFTEAGRLHDKPWVKPLGLSVRAGAIKAAVLICASIAEAVLRASAETRGYPLPREPYRRTFGKVLDAWKQEDGKPRSDVAAIWPTLQNLRDIRNNIHLFKAADDPSASFDTILELEERILADAQAAIRHLSELSP
jgi:hypothetical protein